MNRLVSIAKSLVGPVILVAVLFAGWTFREQLFPKQESIATSEGKSATEGNPIVDKLNSARSRM